jgi:hypothetical protein
MNIESVKTTDKFNNYDASLTSHYPGIPKTSVGTHIKNAPELTTGNFPVLSTTAIELLIDKATGLIQNITKDGLTNEVLRKMPSDEYLKLLQLMNNGISNSLDDSA